MCNLIPRRLIAAIGVLAVFQFNLAMADDFNGDGRSDILWRNLDDGQNWLYTMDGADIQSSNFVNRISNFDWSIVGTGDYDADGDSDIVLRNSATGQNWMYQMAGPTIEASTQINIVANPNWKIVGDGDYNGDGKADILLRNALTGQNWVYLMDGANVASSLSINTVANLNWQIAASADFDGDGKSDIWLRHSVTGLNWVYLMDGATISASLSVNTVANPDWTIAGSGDYNGDGNADVLWYNTATGQVWVYLMDGATILTSSNISTVANLNWQPVGDGDYDGDGRSDILWRNIASGQNLLYRMNGASILAVLAVNTVSNLDWNIVEVIPPFLNTSGFNARPSNTTCVAPAQPTGNASVAAELAFPSLPVNGFGSRPLALLQAPGDASQWYVVAKDGLVSRFENSPTVSSTNTFIDLSGNVDSSYNESGLLGMAFHPDYASNGQVFLSYTAAGAPLTSRISRFTTSDGGLTLDPSSEEILLTLSQPSDPHNGGNIVFGPDGFLYAGFGDGGVFGDPAENAQNTSNLFGSVVRIDVDGGVPYGIPATNPNFGNALCNAGSGAAPCPEIFAWGFRNPWRWSFDSATGDLWLADVGQFSYEEVDLVERGGNYGWRCREGAHDFDTTGNCPVGLIDPIIELSHAGGDGNSITGGFVYRGTAIPELVGRYIFADYVSGKIFASTTDSQGNYGYELLFVADRSVPSFGQDENGELLYLAFGIDKNIQRIVQSGGTSNNTIPNQLSATGCVNPVNATQPATGLIPYEINTPFWSDGADKERFYAIPNGTTINVDADGDWLMPVGTVLMKHFRINNELFETRLFMRHTNGNWAGYTYEWNQAGTDATRVIGGKVKDIQGQSWIYPSESQCMSCHTQTANFSLGVEHAQLNRALQYPGTGIVANQLDTASMIKMLTSPIEDDPVNLPQLYDLTNPGTPPPAEDLSEASRSYLHSNCAGCHRPSGPTPSNMDLRFNTAFSATNTCGVSPTSGDLGVSNAKLVSPGIASESIIPNRMNRRDVHGMPPLGSAISDANGVSLVNQWINSLTVCP